VEVDEEMAPGPEYDEAIHDACTDPVRTALNSPAIDLVVCDKDVRS